MSDLLSRSKEYLDFIKGKDCLVAGRGCMGSVVPAHLEAVGMGNNRKRLSYRHFSTLPLCYAHHIEQEGKTPEFNHRHNIDLYREALSLFIEFLSGVAAPFHNDKGKR